MKVDTLIYLKKYIRSDRSMNTDELSYQKKSGPIGCQVFVNKQATNKFIPALIFLYLNAYINMIHHKCLWNRE